VLVWPSTRDACSTGPASLLRLGRTFEQLFRDPLIGLGAGPAVGVDRGTGSGEAVPGDHRVGQRCLELLEVGRLDQGVAQFQLLECVFALDQVLQAVLPSQPGFIQLQLAQLRAGGQRFQ